MAKNTDVKGKKAAAVQARPVKKAANVMNTPKKAAANAKNNISAVKKSTPIKKAAAVKVAAKSVALKKLPVTKKTPAKIVEPVKKASVQKQAVTPKNTVAKKAVQNKNLTAVKKAATSVKASQPAKKAAAAKKSTPAPVAKKAMPKLAVKPADTKEKRADRDTTITKKIKQEAQPLKEVKVPKITTTAKQSYHPTYTPLDQRSMDMSQEPFMRYNEEELNEFKSIIMKKLADAKREVSYLQGIITRRDDLGGDIESRYMTMEDGTISMEREQQSQMASRQITFIDNLEKALIRIENKTYGICRVTGKLIDKARLRAVPHATLSMEAKLSRKNANDQ